MILDKFLVIYSSLFNCYPNLFSYAFIVLIIPIASIRLIYSNYSNNTIFLNLIIISIISKYLGDRE